MATNQSINTTINQESKFMIVERLYRRHGWGGMLGGVLFTHCLGLGAMIGIKPYPLTADYRPLCTQQPTKIRSSQWRIIWVHRGGVSRGERRGVVYHCFWSATSSNNIKRLKQMSRLLTIFFTPSRLYLTKPHNTPLRQPPPAEAPGGAVS